MFGEVFDVSNFLNTNEPKSLDDFKNILSAFDKLKVCQGLNIKNEYKILKTNFGPDELKELYGRFRHTNCTKIISEEIG